MSNADSMEPQKNKTNVLVLIAIGVLALIVMLNQRTGRVVYDDQSDVLIDATPEYQDQPSYHLNTDKTSPPNNLPTPQPEDKTVQVGPQSQQMRFPCNQRLNVASPNTIPFTADQIYPSISFDRRVYQPSITDVFIMRSIPVTSGSPPVFLDALILGAGGMPPPRNTVRVSTETQNLAIVGTSPTAFDQGVTYTKTPGGTFASAEVWWTGTGPDAVFGNRDDIPPRRVAQDFLGEIRGRVFPIPGGSFQQKASDIDGDAIIYITRTRAAVYYSLGEDIIPGTGDEQRVPVNIDTPFPCRSTLPGGPVQPPCPSDVTEVGVSTLGFAVMLDKSWILYHDNGPDRGAYNVDDQERIFTPTADLFVQMDTSQDSGHLVWTEGFVGPLITWPNYLRVYNPGPDERMGGTDDQVNLISSGPVHYDPSITRSLLVYLTADPVVSPSVPDTIHFRQPGPDGYYGTTDDILQSIPLGPIIYEWLSLQSVGNGKFAVWADKTNGITMYHPC